MAIAVGVGSFGAGACGDDFEVGTPSVTVPEVTAPAVTVTVPEVTVTVPTTLPLVTSPPPPTSAPPTPAPSEPAPAPTSTPPDVAAPDHDTDTGGETSSADDASGWDHLWWGGRVSGDGLGAFFAGFANGLAAFAAALTYALTAFVLTLALLALVVGFSAALWPLLALVALLGSVLGGFFGMFGVAMAVIAVTSFALGRGLRRRDATG
ncbi:MAG TPA: hypothetical protein VM345_02185 [Acidimicrobiales bacterium]|nr:hypothetical protein [Acidimicrobiales bacterium]